VSDIQYYLLTRTNLVHGAWNEIPVTPAYAGQLEEGVDAVEVDVDTAEHGRLLFWRLMLRR
jgi:hypothetical protein